MPRPQTRDNTYWRFQYPDLTKQGLRNRLIKAGYAPRSNLWRDDLVSMLSNHEKGRMDYKQCTKDEIRRFALDRGILSPKTIIIDDYELRLTLTQSDYNRTFTCFSELPPELRVRVHEFYIASITDEPVALPNDPPLTCASRLLRAEALPIFYSACTFRLNIAEAILWSTDFDRGSTNFLKACSKEKIGMMRKLDVDVTVGSNNIRRRTVQVTTIEARLNAAGDEYTVQVQKPLVSNRSEQWCTQLQVEFRAAFEAVLENVVSREGTQGLRLEDVLAFNAPIVSGRLFNTAGMTGRGYIR